MERLKYPQCSHEWTPRALAHDTSRGYFWICCPCCGGWEKRGEHTVVDHTCANCRFQQNDHCSRIVQELNMYTIHVSVKPKFSCSLWEERKEEGPFEIVQECNHGLYRIDSSVSPYAGPHLYAKAQAEELRDWLNLQWNERKE